MEKTAIAAGTEPTMKSGRTSARECERKKQLEETRRWISVNAVKVLRKAWRH